jgi:hypothetical protein
LNIKSGYIALVLLTVLQHGWAQAPRVPEAVIAYPDMIV